MAYKRISPRVLPPEERTSSVDEALKQLRYQRDDIYISSNMVQADMDQYIDALCRLFESHKGEFLRDWNRIEETITKTCFGDPEKEAETHRAKIRLAVFPASTTKT
jgi:hypothetical protein